MTTQLIRITLFAPNPWQTRPVDDDHMRALAADIAANGLLQPPVARPHPKDKSLYQLALGHHRLAAFALLHTKDPNAKAWASIPTLIRDLTDLEMADIAIAENEKRKSLSPIEKAQALRRLIDEFKLGQEDAGKRFGLTQSGVSNLLRLLKLPAPIQALTDGTRLPERHARGLVSLAKSLPAQAEAIAKKVAAADPEEKDSVFESGVMDALRKYGRQMYNPPFRADEQLPIEHVAKAAGKLGLTVLPLCKGCEFFTERGHINHCMRPGCFDAKKESAMWKAAAVHAKTLGIALAAPGEKVELVFDGDDNRIALAKAALKVKHPSLRMVISEHASNDTWRPEARARRELLGLEWFALASTDVAALKKSLPKDVVTPKVVTKGKPKKDSYQERQKEWAAKQRQRDAERKAANHLIDVAAAVVAPVMSNDETMIRLIAAAVGDRSNKPTRLSTTRKLLKIWIQRHTNFEMKPETTAPVLIDLAGKLKVKLPADLANGHDVAKAKSPKPEPKAKRGPGRPAGVSTGKLTKRAKAQAAKPVVKKGKRK